ncbi:MAG: hypothetical protein JSR86_14455 [Proteobacteria bacterium]|nr:hypothetical protein [Pseudomonadota bacterium]
MSILTGLSYRVIFQLYSKDGARAVDVMEFEGGEIYLNEQERREDGAYENRHSGNLVGPFATSEAAEAFIVGTTWFNDGPT